MKASFINIQKKANMKNVAKIIVLLVLISVGHLVKAQQEPTFTQYMFNSQLINPAYAGSWETMGFTIHAREQWIGIENRPSTQNFVFQTLLKNEAVGLGLNVINDKFGFEKRIAVYGDYSYRIKINETAKLRLGLKYGFSSYSNNMNDYVVLDQNDPRFQGVIENKFMPNFGVGAYLYDQNYYLGFSVPRFLNNKFTDTNNNFSTQTEVRNFYLMGGYVFNLSEKLKFKPAFLAKAVSGLPAQIDLNANFLIADRVWLGGMYRTGDSFGFMAQINISRSLRFGYSIDFSTNELKNYQNGTHEVFISYELNHLGKELGVRLF